MEVGRSPHDHSAPSLEIRIINQDYSEISFFHVLSFSFPLSESVYYYSMMNDDLVLSDAMFTHVGRDQSRRLRSLGYHLGRLSQSDRLLALRSPSLPNPSKTTNPSGRLSRSIRP